MKFNSVYAAYGSNLNHKQMAIRCPNARFLGVGQLLDFRLVFRQVADIEHEENKKTLVGLWRITPKCLEALDKYEGYPHLYERFETAVLIENKSIQATVYYMKLDYGYEPPSITYYQSIEQGYKDCKMPISHLKKQLDRTAYYYNNQDFV